MTARDTFHEADLTRRWKLESFTVTKEPLHPLDISIRQVWFRAERNDAINYGRESYRDYRLVNGYVYELDVPTPLPLAQREERRHRFKAECLSLLRQGTSYWKEVCLPELQANIEHLKRFPATEEDPRELAGHIRESVAVFERHWEIHWHLGSEFAIERFLATYSQLLHGSENEARELLQGVPTLTSELVEGLQAMAAIARPQPSSLAALQRGRTPSDPAFSAAYAAFMTRFGLRTGNGYGSGITLLEPTWLEYPRPVLQLVASYAAAPEQGHPAAQPPPVPASRLGAGRARGERFRQELEQAREAAGLLENHNYYIEQVTGGLLRMAVIRLARALVLSGHLETVDDVFFLYLNELINAPAVPPLLTRDRVVEHKHQRQVWSRTQPPAELGGTEPAQMLLASASPASAGDGVLRGVAASRGVATGKAVVALDRQAIPDIQPGEVLVARNAGPLWSPLLPLLGALVLDQGAILQHAALLAREYGVPAVFMTGDATSVIPDGALVRVDGGAGTVTVVGDQAAQRRREIS